MERDTPPAPSGYSLSGRGVLRYGDQLLPLRAGDCVLVYLAIGAFDPDEVCAYPDNGKVLVRGLKLIGKLEPLEYMAGEPDRPKVFELIEEHGHVQR